MSELIWSETEKTIAHEAFTKAYERETLTLIQHIREQAGEIVKLDDVWRLHDFLSARRHQIDGRYDYRYPALLFVFADLLKEGWLSLEDLEGLETDKLSKIKALARL